MSENQIIATETPDDATKPAVSPRGHIPSLDNIRALAVTIVAVSHVWEDLPIPGRFGVTSSSFSADS